MADALAGGKFCIVCGADVSGEPRVQDAQGRYVCAGECHQQLAAKFKGAGGVGGGLARAQRLAVPGLHRPHTAARPAAA